MKYRQYRDTDIQLSQLGFGCMRFPVLDGDQGRIDKASATEMLDYAIQNGVNYLDTAYFYHKGQSESFVGEYLTAAGVRENIYLATKLPPAVAKEKGAKNVLEDQLNKLQTDYLDFYMFHQINQASWKIIKEYDLLDFM
ncbi:aldo/keto reductase, partial [Eubacteriales bacterium OttesenSCG-928-M02]|nr:aldo/keto reductase [Eubacteriales bacterium OttesenSCG-928-M02]